MATSGDHPECPQRQHMTAADITWRYGEAPNFDVVNAKYLKEKTRSHKAESLEKLLENILKTIEMELSHKIIPKQWGSMTEDFTLHCNGYATYAADELAKIGTYNAFLMKCPYYDAKGETFDSSHVKFKSAYPGGFAFEVLDVFSGPPTISFSWRHWAHFEGNYGDTAPSGELLEMFGTAVATVNDSLQASKFEVFYDPTPMFFKLNGGKSQIDDI